MKDEESEAVPDAGQASGTNAQGEPSTTNNGEATLPPSETLDKWKVVFRSHPGPDRIHYLAVFEKPPHDDELIPGWERSWYGRKIITWEAFSARCRAVGLPPDMGVYLLHEMDFDFEVEFRQAAFAHIRASDLDEFAGWFFVRNYGGGPAVCKIVERYEKDERGHFVEREEMDVMSPERFKASWPDKFVDIDVPDNVNGGFKKKWVKAADHWISTAAPTYERLVFAPGREAPAGAFNVWRNWPKGLQGGSLFYELTGALYRPPGNTSGDYAYVPKPEEDSDYDKAEPPRDCCPWFIDHMYYNMCDEDDDHFNYLCAWMADALWNPGPSLVAVILRGFQGGGKSYWAKRFAEFFGPHALTLTNPKHVVGNFNAHLMNKQFVYADEAFYAGNHQHAAALKTLVTDEDLFVEPKGRDGFMARKHWRIALSSNDRHSYSAELDDRRAFVLEVDAGKHNNDAEYFGRMMEEWRTGGRRDLFRWLAGRHWGEQVAEGRFKLNWRRPVTGALQEQKDLSLRGAELVIHNMLHEGEVPCEFCTEPGGRVFVPTVLLAAARRVEEKDYTALGNLLRMLEDRDGGQNNRRMIGGERVRGSILPPLGECRRRWEAHLKRAVQWPEGVTEWGVGPGSQPPF